MTLLHAYWGYLAAQFAWEGASCLRKPAPDPEPHGIQFPQILNRSHFFAELRQPPNHMIARFFGDMFCYLNNCGSSENPGTITKRILETLVAAHEIIERNGEPLIVLSHSMGGQIEYDIVTHFLPKSPKYSNLKIDFWCSVASQVGLFEEMKLFIASSNLYSKQNGNKVPFPNKNHLEAWLNVWDMDDILSYSVCDIIEGVDDMSFRVGHWLINAHVGYLQE